MPETKHARKTTRSTKEIKRALPEFLARDDRRPKLEIVLKCDTMGSVEAISALLSRLTAEAEIKLIQAGVGNVSKQDLLMALTGSRLVVGFNVDVAPKLDQWVKEHGVEVRLYNVIYKMADDLKTMAASLIPAEPEDRVTGKCEVIATFKSRKGGVILGCEVVEGTIQVGRQFRVVTAMGPVHSAKIESLQIEKQKIKEAKAGQQIGVQVSGSTLGQVGDFIECYEVVTPRGNPWTPKGRILHMQSH